MKLSRTVASALLPCLTLGVWMAGLVPSSAATSVNLQAVSFRSSTLAVRGLGDSVPFATGCGCTSYVVQFGQELARHRARHVSVINQAQEGFTSAGLRDQVQSMQTRARNRVVTIVTIGANDFSPAQLSSPGCTADEGMACYRGALSQLGKNVAATLKTLSGGTSHATILVTGYWNVFLDGQVGAAKGDAYVRDSAALTMQVNDVLRQAASNDHDTFVDLAEPFHRGDITSLLEDDGDHPSAAGHKLITDLLWNAMMHGSRSPTPSASPTVSASPTPSPSP